MITELRQKLARGVATGRRGAGVILICFSLVVGLLNGCSGGGGTEVGNPGMYSSFSDDQSLEKYLKNGLATSVSPTGSLTGAQEAVAAAQAPSNTSGNGGAGTDSGFSQTNVQEAGVDEADKIKSDGEYIYIAKGETVAVVRALPDGTTVTSSVVKTPGPVTSLYVDGNLLVALYVPQGGNGAPWSGGAGLPEPDVRVGMPYWLPVAVETGVLLVDVSDRQVPSVLADWVFDGNLVASRRIGSKLHLVQQFWPDLPPLQYLFDGSRGGYDATVAANRAILDPLTLGDLLPGYRHLNGNGELLDAGRVVATADFLAPDQPQGGSVVSIISLDLDHPTDRFASIAAVLDAHHVYASPDSLYLANQRFDAMFGGGDEQLVVHKFSLGGETITYAGSGTVPGWVLNQFSFGEADDILRIATTSGLDVASWKNNVYCLQAESGALRIVGRLENLARGEKIYAARFLGARGYLVTFQQIDPLLTLDLTDPTKPRLVGELKVPGYSDYIHPLGGNHLLTLGKDVALSGDVPYYQGLQLSIFDVSKLEAPTLLHQVTIGARGTDSEALQDHKAFGFWPERNLLAIPVTLAEFTAPPVAPWSFGDFSFRGLYVYEATPEAGFVFQGRISTVVGESLPSYPIPWARGLFIGDYVHAITPEAVWSAAVEDITESPAELLLP